MQELLPEKRMLFQPNLAKAVGSKYIAQRIEELRPVAHIFGHTHFLWDATIKKVRYVQWCLGTPKERRYELAPYHAYASALSLPCNQSSEPLHGISEGQMRKSAGF